MNEFGDSRTENEVEDVFALRRVSDEQLVNLAGVGRGEGWAGNISIDPDREALIAQAMSSHALVRHSGANTRIFGPYWATDAAILPVGDFVVVMGGAGVADLDDDALTERAADVAWSVGDVSAEKRLADELELTKAALAVASLPVGTLDEFLETLAGAAVEALSCEFGAVVLVEPERRVITALNGWQPEVESEVLAEALQALVEGVPRGSATVHQDLRHAVDGSLGSEQIPEGDAATFGLDPLGFQQGLVSRCIVPVGQPGNSGYIVVAHSVASPRGFTTLCRRVAESIGEQASRVLGDRFTSPVSAHH